MTGREHERLRVPDRRSQLHTVPAGHDRVERGKDEERVAGVDTPGGEISVAQLAKNDIVGEIGILCDVPRTATVRAIDDVTTLAISKDLFFQMVREYPDMGIEIMRELADRLEKTTTQLREARSA